MSYRARSGCIHDVRDLMKLNSVTFVCRDVQESYLVNLFLCLSKQRRVGSDSMCYHEDGLQSDGHFHLQLSVLRTNLVSQLLLCFEGCTASSRPSQMQPCLPRKRAKRHSGGNTGSMSSPGRNFRLPQLSRPAHT